MEFILYIVIIVFLIVIKNNIRNNYNQLERKILNLQRNIQLLQEKILQKEQIIKEKENVIPKENIKKEELENVIIHKKEAVVEEKEKDLEEININNTSKIYPVKEEVKEKTNQFVKKVKTKSFFEKFKDKNPDLEKFIGENIINKIGILILVLGISFLVKYAIDKNWINEPARVGIGILCGSLVMGIAHKLKKNYAAFSSVLVAGAISIFYFTIYIAFHEYQLFSQTIAFSIMALITAFSVLVSISYNRQELAVLSLIGGFSAPFMLSTGDGNYKVLFSYIVILDMGILAISYFKKWKISTLLAFAFTLLLFTGWLFVNIDTKTFSYLGALVFSTIFYFLFSIIIVLNNLKNKGTFSAIEYAILIINTFIYFGIGMTIFSKWNVNFRGIFTLLLAMYNILFAAILFKKFGLEKNAIYLLIGLSLTFVTLTIPIQFQGNHITLFWAAESVLLIWLSQKSKIKSFIIGAIIVQFLAIISLLIDWNRYFLKEEFLIILNPLFLAGVIVSLSLVLNYWLLQKEDDIKTKFFKINIKAYRIIVLIATIFIIYFTGILELKYQANEILSNSASILALPTTYHFIFISVLLYISTLRKKDKITKIILGISIVSIAVYILKLYALPSKEIIENYIEETNLNYAFFLHYVILICLIYLGYNLFVKLNQLFKLKDTQLKWLPWLFIFTIVYVFSNELIVHSLYFLDSVDSTELVNNNINNIYVKNNFIEQQIKEAKIQVIKIGYPILWGAFSFLFLIIGIKKQWKNLRIIALSLLGLTIVKLFVYDIKNVSETGKIIAFILLGVLILVISFVYQKIKKLVIDEKQENEKV